jgi:hypothetical protein
MDTQTSWEFQMFKKFILAVFILISMTGCASPTTTEDGLPILRVNDQHLSLGNYPGEIYEIQSGKGFALDFAGYRFRIPQSLGIDSVNEIQISVGPDQIYSIPIQQTVTLYKLTNDTLNPVGKSLPIEGFKEGDTITIGIGYTFPDGRFYPAWLGIISVKGSQP